MNLNRAQAIQYSWLCLCCLYLGFKFIKLKEKAKTRSDISKIFQPLFSFSIVKLSQHHEIGICVMQNLKKLKCGVKQLIQLILQCLLTFLKTFRVQAILPKHSNVTGFCAIAMIVGKNRFNSIGNICQLNWAILESISANASHVLWPSSQHMKTSVNPTIPLMTGSRVTMTSAWCN